MNADVSSGVEPATPTVRHEPRAGNSRARGGERQPLDNPALDGGDGR